MAGEIQRIVVIGVGGRLGGALMRAYRDKFEIIGFDHEDLDLAKENEIRTSIEPLEFDVLINAAAFTNVDLCESKREEAFQINATAPKILAEICATKHAKLIHFSTDYVFDGSKREPYTESDPANPISAYGESKRAGELQVLGVDEKHLVVRVSWVLGPARPSFIDAMIKRAQEEDRIAAVSDKFSTPTYTKDIAEMLPQFFSVAGAAGPGSAAIGRGYNYNIGGILHFANTGQCSWQEYAQFAIDTCLSLGMPLKVKAVAAIKLADMMRSGQSASPARTWVARRPVYSVLSSEKFSSVTGAPPRSWRDAVAEYIRATYFKS